MLVLDIVFREGPNTRLIYDSSLAKKIELESIIN